MVACPPRRCRRGAGLNSRRHFVGTLDGKVAIVSGSGRGIGRAVALRLASAGAKLVVNDLDEAPALETVAAIEAAGGEAVACVGTVTAPDFGERFVRCAPDRFGGGSEEH